MDKITIYLKLDNWNDTIKRCRGNKYSANSHKKAEMKQLSFFLNKISKIDKYPVKMTFKWHIKSSNSDLDNKSIKSILDAMQNIGKLENDNIKHINEIKYIAIPDKREFVEMEIEYNGDAENNTNINNNDNINT